MTTTMIDKEVTPVIRKCGECGGTMEGRRENYHYTECGLQSVFLRNILVFHCKCGAIMPRIPAMGFLHAAITLDLITKETLLSAEEIKFLRKVAGMNGVELAALLGIHKGTLSKYENGQRAIAKNSDAALRLFCFVGMMQQLLQRKDLLPEFQMVINKLTSMDIKHILQMVKNELTGSKSIRFDPEQLPLFGFPVETAGQSGNAIH